MTPDVTVQAPSVGRVPFASRSHWDVFTLGALLLVALVVYAVAWPQAPVITPDTPSYIRLASDISHLHISRLHQRTPGYPLIMALAGSAEAPTRLLFWLMLALQFGATAGIAVHLRRMGISRASGILFVALALLPPFVAPAAYAETETTAQFAIVLTYLGLVAWLTIGRWKAFALFVLAGTFTAFVRPTYELLVPVLAIGALLVSAAAPARPKLFQRCAALILATGLSAAALGSYAFLNYRRFGYFDLSYMGAYALNHKTAGVVEFLPDRFGPMREILIRHRDRLLVAPYDDHTGENYIYRAVPELLALYGGDQVRMLKEIKKANIYLITHKPFSFIHEGLKSIGSYWMPIEYPLITGDSGALRGASAAFQWLFIGVWLLQALVVGGASVLWLSALAAGYRTPVLDDNRRALLTGWLVGMAIILYTLMISCFAGIGDPRYRTPADLVMIGNTFIGYSLWRKSFPALFGPRAH